MLSKPLSCAAILYRINMKKLIHMVKFNSYSGIVLQEVPYSQGILLGAKNIVATVVVGMNWLVTWY